MSFLKIWKWPELCLRSDVNLELFQLCKNNYLRFLLLLPSTYRNAEFTIVLMCALAQGPVGQGAHLPAKK
jgi:hypothetical protein